MLFFDEVNRCPQKLQNALLQVLEEGYATVGSYKVDFTANFIFIGTMNPQDSNTEQLSHVFLDRFDLIYVDHPKTVDEEKLILSSKGQQLGAEVPDDMSTFIVRFIHKLRSNELVIRKPSVRATLGLYERAQANALLDKRSKVGYKDIFNAVYSVIPHRIELKPSVKYLQSPAEFVHEQLANFAKSQKIDIEPDEGEVP